MYCPNCGTRTSDDQNFCRACGLGLEKVAASLAEQTPAKVDRTLQQQKERYQHMGMAALGVFALGLLVFISYSVGYKLTLSQGNILTALAIIGFIIMAACGLTSVVMFAKAKELGEGASKRPRQENLASGESTRELLSEGKLRTSFQYYGLHH